ncbi:MAG TPA: tetratricopeptide repeat protein [Tepidisphaeraceae bacterium]|jgi:superkiller protein 3
MRNVSEGTAAHSGARLKAFLNNVDPALLESLRQDERRRRRKLALLSITGGLVMGSTIAILCFLLFAPQPSVSPQKADQALALSSDGWQLWQAGKLDAAAEKFRQAVALDPTNANAFNGLGWALLNGGDAKGAEEAFNKCIAIEKNHPAAMNGLGQIAYARHDFATAEKRWLAVAKEAPAACVGLARLYLLQGKFDQAAKYAQMAADSPGADPFVRQLLAAAKAGKVDPELKASLEPPPANSSDLSLGWAQFNQGKPNQAKETFEKVLAKDPNNAEALNGLGFALLSLGKPADAKPQFEKSLKLDPNAAGAMNGLARCLKAEGKIDEAIALWQKMTDQFPGPNAGTAGLAMTYFERKQFDKAAPLLEQLAKADPSNPEWQQMLDQAKGGTQK